MRQLLTFALSLSCCCLSVSAPVRLDKAGVQQSAEFEREGDSWQLKLYPAGGAGDVDLSLQLASEDRPADYLVERCYLLRVLHPTNADRSVWRPAPVNGVRVPYPFFADTEWTHARLIEAADVDDFVHKGHLTLQAVVWQPTEEQIKAAANNRNYLHRLRSSFSDTPDDAYQLVVAQHGGDVTRAYVELKQWSPIELKQPLKDESGREIFTWRVPLEQCQSIQRKPPGGNRPAHAPSLTP